jgi:hypothetical protein
MAAPVGAATALSADEACITLAAPRRLHLSERISARFLGTALDSKLIAISSRFLQLRRYSILVSLDT